MEIKTIPTHEKDPQEEKAPRKLLETTSVKMARFIDEHDMANRNEKSKENPLTNVEKKTIKQYIASLQKNRRRHNYSSTSATDICIPVG